MSNALEQLVAQMRRVATPVPLGSRLEARGGAPRSAWLQATIAQDLLEEQDELAAPIEMPITEDLDALKEAARREGEREGLRAAQEKIETLAQRYLDAIEQFDVAMRRIRRPESGEIVDLALTLAAELLGHELSIDRDPLVAAIEGALSGIEERRGVIVRLGKADFAYLTNRRPDLTKTGYFVEDQNLSIGSCIIETPQEVHDLTIERRLGAMRDALREVLASQMTADTEVEDVQDVSPDAISAEDHVG